MTRLFWQSVLSVALFFAAVSIEAQSGNEPVSVSVDRETLTQRIQSIQAAPGTDAQLTDALLENFRKSLCSLDQVDTKMRRPSVT